MRLSTRATYGLRAMLGLAMAYGEGPVMVRQLSERQGLPATYLEQLMVPLKRTGLVLATRGAHGGYVLSRPPAQITTAEIIEVLDGPCDLVECSTIASCTENPQTCVLKAFLTEASEALLTVFRNTTLADLAERQRLHLAEMAGMYSI